jgi:endo-1,4-beta-xylanase
MTTTPVNPNAGGEEWRAMVNEVVPDPGRHAAAVAAARARIPGLRMRPVTLRLVDRAGRPLAGKPVRIEQQRSAFCWGENLWGQDTHWRNGSWHHDRARAERDRFLDLFNACNALCYWTERPRHDGPKSEERLGEPRYDGFAAMVDWGLANHLTVKGHPLFWSIPKAVPDWAQRYDRDTFMRFLEVRIRSLTARFKGKVRIWDAINEPLWEACPWRLAERRWPHIEPVAEMADYIAPVLGWARAEDPDALLVVNDYGLERTGEKPPMGSDGLPTTAERQRQRMVELVEELRRRGRVPDAIGMQGHTGTWNTPDEQNAIYDDLARAGVPLHLTEFHVKVDELTRLGVPEDEARAIQADYLEGFLTTILGHQAIDACFFWSMFGQLVRFGKDANDSGHDLLPLFHRLRGLLHDRWMTRLDAGTDDQGVVRFSGFFGDYSVRTATGGQRFTVAKGQDGVQQLVCTT